MEKPVIILGGGYLGTLLAYRLKETRPEIPFMLYEESSTLGGEKSEIFFQNIPHSWLQPFITKSWNEFNVGSEKNKRIKGCWHHIDGGFFNQYTKSVLSSRLELNKMPTPESALRQSAFVIDTRNNGHFSRTVFQLDFSVEVVLENEHFLKTPLLCSLNQTSHDREGIISFYPLGPRRLFISETWTSCTSGENFKEMQDTLISHIYQRGWRVSRILKEEKQIIELPLSRAMTRNEGRVISLAGLFHGPKGSSIPQMAKLVERVVGGSFRFGEVQRIVKDFRLELEAKGRAYFPINELVERGRLADFYRWLEHRPPEFIEHYLSMNLSFIDKMRIKVLMTYWESKGYLPLGKERERNLSISEIH